MKVPREATIQNTFCQRNVVFVPAIRIRVMTTIIESAPQKIHQFSVWNRPPQSTSALLLKKIPSVTSVGPSVKTGKYRAQNVAPIMAEKVAAKFDTVASG